MPDFLTELDQRIGKIEERLERAWILRERFMAIMEQFSEGISNIRRDCTTDEEVEAFFGRELPAELRGKIIARTATFEEMADFIPEQEALIFSLKPERPSESRRADSSEAEEPGEEQVADAPSGTVDTNECIDTVRLLLGKDCFYRLDQLPPDKLEKLALRMQQSVREPRQRFAFVVSRLSDVDMLQLSAEVQREVRKLTQRSLPAKTPPDSKVRELALTCLKGLRTKMYDGWKFREPRASILSQAVRDFDCDPVAVLLVEYFLQYSMKNS